MDLNRNTLIQKIITKGVILTPFESIHLKYLSRKGLINSLIEIEKTNNPHIGVNRINTPISPYMVSFIANRAAQASPDLYRQYNYAYMAIFDHDSNSEKRGYMGLMLITQLRLIRSEYQRSFRQLKNITLLDASAYSYYHLKQTTFTQTLDVLAQTFKYFIWDIDIILTLNYYLRQLIELEDLSCLKLLRAWISKPRESVDDEFTYLNGAHLCCSESNIKLLLDQHHQSFVSSLETKLNSLPIDFGEGSKQYVLNTMKQIVKQ